MRLSQLLSLGTIVIAATAAVAGAETLTVQQTPTRLFAPASLIVRVGDTVTWVNADTRGHTTTSGADGVPDGIFDSGNMGPGASFSYTFTAAGSYPYYCDYHLPDMVGVVTVLADAVVVRQLEARVFDPPAVTIAPGWSVIWRNDSTHGHTTTSGPEGSPDGRFDSGNMDPGSTFSYTFPTAGAYPYYCDYHSGMIGEVTVAAVPTGVVLHAVKRGFDVELVWTGGSSPWDVKRGESRTLSDLAVVDTVSAGPTDMDLGAVVGPPNEYYYQVE